MRINDLLEEKMNALPASRVRDAMTYSLMSGGKRIRPQLLYEVVKGYGKEEETADPFACALEMIQTYSLIHDDLPAMDNDDLRRGQPSCHKKFDEATAILAGDGLLTYAFETAAASDAEPHKVSKCIEILAEMAGPSGMVLGQQLDTTEDKSVLDWNGLKNIFSLKTGCLLSAPLMMGAVLSDHEEDVPLWRNIGDSLGVAFQIQDDLLDVEMSAEQLGKSNSDARNDKVTAVTILGKQKAEAAMNDLYENAEGSISLIKDFQPDHLLKMVAEIANRRK